MNQDIVREREQLEAETAAALVALRETPAFQRFAAAEMRLHEHLVIYGTGDLTRDTAGLFGVPDEFDDDDQTCDFDDEVIT